MNMIQVKKYKKSVKRILHFMSKMALESGTSPITFTVKDEFDQDASESLFVDTVSESLVAET
jgi:hypothetical protein